MIDWSQIDELREEIGEDGLTEILELCFEEITANLEQVSRIQEPGALEAGYHAIRGGALSVGLTGLAGRCQDAEQAAAAGIVDEGAPAQIQELIAQAAKAVSALPQSRQTSN